MVTENTLPAQAAGTARAVLHVGAPKTGTTYLQAVLWRNRVGLREAGVLYPLERPADSFLATVDVREMGWGGRFDGPWHGRWDAVAERVEAWEGSVVFSNELLGGATPDQARRIVDTMAGGAGREVHVVFTARDLARQLSSDWQEHVKHRHDVTLARFVGDLVRLGRDAPEPFGELFWGLHDAEAVLRTWAAVVPVEQLHLVTVPKASTGPHELWARFARAAGLDLPELNLDVEPRNVSLGVAEAELLRRLNTVLKGKFPHRSYEPLIREVLAENLLVSPRRSVPATERPSLPPEYRDWVVDRSKRLIDAIVAAGYDVEGDLDDLLPSFGSDGRQPEELTADDLLAVALDALAGTLRHVAEGGGPGSVAAELRREVTRLEADLARTRQQLDYWRDGGVAHRLVRFSDRHPWAMPARRAYTGARRRLHRGRDDA